MEEPEPGEDIDLEQLRSRKAKSGYLMGVTVTTSKKFQARIFIKTGVPQLDLGTFDSAEDAARAVAAAKARRKRGPFSTSLLNVNRCERPIHTYISIK